MLTSTKHGNPEFLGGNLTDNITRHNMPLDRSSKMPMMPNNMRLVAICAAEVETILDGSDTWMFEDELLLWHLLQGLTKNQTWIIPEFDVLAFLEKQKDAV